MARRRKKHGGSSKNSLRSYVRKAASVGSSIIAAGPVLVPMAQGVQDGLATKSPKSAMYVFVYEASGYNPTSNQIDVNKLTEVIIRDVAMVAIGMGLKKLSKHI